MVTVRAAQLAIDALALIRRSHLGGGRDVRVRAGSASRSHALAAAC